MQSGPSPLRRTSYTTRVRNPASPGTRLFAVTGIVIPQKTSQSHLAATADIAREKVRRVLNDWKSRKLISRLSGYYCLEN